MYIQPEAGGTRKDKRRTKETVTQSNQETKKRDKRSKEDRKKKTDRPRLPICPSAKTLQLMSFVEDAFVSKSLQVVPDGLNGQLRDQDDRLTHTSHRKMKGIDFVFCIYVCIHACNKWI